MRIDDASDALPLHRKEAARVLRCAAARQAGFGARNPDKNTGSISGTRRPRRGRRLPAQEFL